MFRGVLAVRGVRRREAAAHRRRVLLQAKGTRTRRAPCLDCQSEIRQARAASQKNHTRASAPVTYPYERLREHWKVPFADAAGEENWTETKPMVAAWLERSARFGAKAGPGQ